MSDDPVEPLDRLREPFPPSQVGLLPQPYKKDAQKGTCGECGKWHGLPAMHLDFVGHGAVTARLLDVDPEWNWEPMALDANGLPALDHHGNLWIRLTVCGVTRLGVGDGASMKVLIGDAIRNAAMRFGVALDLWIRGSEDEKEHAEEQIARPWNKLEAKKFVLSLAEATEVAAAAWEAFGDSTPWTEADLRVAFDEWVNQDPTEIVSGEASDGDPDGADSGDVLEPASEASTASPDTTPEETVHVRFCPDGLPECADCRSGDDLMWSEVCDTCGRTAPEMDRSDCPYFLRYSGAEGHDPKGTCSYGCRDEPSCITDRPRHGWPSEQAALSDSANGAQS